MQFENQVQVDGGYPSNQVFRDEWHFMEYLMQFDDMRTMYVYGPPGVGKTYTATRSGLKGRNVYSITLTPETPAAELRGFFVPKDREFVWHDGPFVRAMREGARVVINEVSHASHDVLAILYPVLEGKDTAALTLPDSTTVVPADGFQVICTDNMPPDELTEALRDRFNSIMEINQPHPDSINSLRPALKRAALKCLEMEDDRRVSMRAWIQVSKLEEKMGTETAFRAVFGQEKGQELFTATTLGTESGNDTRTEEEVPF